MRCWMKILPWFIVMWFARNYCEKLTHKGNVVIKPFKNGPMIIYE
jgi:hypothetical protein